MNESYVDDGFIQKVIDQYSDTIFRVSFQYVRNTQDAEDVMQEVFLSLLEHLSRANFQSDEHLKAWLIRVAINKSINLLKSNARRKKREIGEQVFENRHLDSQYDELEAMLFKLSALDREIIYLRYYEGYSAKEIAAFLDKTEKAIFKRLSRARNKLKEFLSEGGESL